MGGACSISRKEEGIWAVGRKPERRRSLGRPICRWVDNGPWRGRMGWCGLDWFGSG
jgi:hypothetical protein